MILQERDKSWRRFTAIGDTLKMFSQLSPELMNPLQLFSDLLQRKRTEKRSGFSHYLPSDLFLTV